MYFTIFSINFFFKIGIFENWPGYIFEFYFLMIKPKKLLNFRSYKKSKLKKRLFYYYIVYFFLQNKNNSKYFCFFEFLYFKFRGPFGNLNKLFSKFKEQKILEKNKLIYIKNNELKNFFEYNLASSFNIVFFNAKILSENLYKKKLLQVLLYSSNKNRFLKKKGSVHKVKLNEVLFKNLSLYRKTNFLLKKKKLLLKNKVKFVLFKYLYKKSKLNFAKYLKTTINGNFYLFNKLKVINKIQLNLIKKLYSVNKLINKQFCYFKRKFAVKTDSFNSLINITLKDKVIKTIITKKISMNIMKYTILKKIYDLVFFLKYKKQKKKKLQNFSSKNQGLKKKKAKFSFYDTKMKRLVKMQQKFLILRFIIYKKRTQKIIKLLETKKKGLLLNLISIKNLIRQLIFIW